ncbi:hypothetical protein ILYODFUR_021350 [Ilyodon furcidens]|uniref:Uncharacterized protein n=1 Tax=Ilyodon furcidens TaxID=33524 RepID=A0ABV0UBD8_9TELE
MTSVDVFRCVINDGTGSTRSYLRTPPDSTSSKRSNDIISSSELNMGQSSSSSDVVIRASSFSGCGIIGFHYPPEPAVTLRLTSEVTAVEVGPLSVVWTFCLRNMRCAEANY